MKTNILLLTMIFALIIATGVASATVSQTNYIRYGIIEDNNALTTTSTAITDSNVLGVMCSSANCSSITGNLFDQLRTGSLSQIQLTYPTVLQNSFGYGLYFYKDGYIPYEVTANWAGTGQAPDGTRYLTKKRTCNIPISGLTVSYSNGQLTVNANVGSPLQNSGPLAYIPSSLNGQYSTAVQITVAADGNGGFSTTQNLDIPFSGQAGINVIRALGAGNHNITVSASTNDQRCLSSPTTIKQENYTVTIPDTTPPGQITNLYSIVTNTTIAWHWDNPTDLDFAGTIVYVDGVNVVNLTSGVHLYLAYGLIPNTTHTITVYTKDNVGNVNNNGVSNTNTTLANNAVIVPDTTPPLVTIVSPENRTYNVSAIQFVVNLNELGNVMFSLNNGATNSTMNSLDNLHFTYNITGLNNGSYTFNAYAMDLSGNKNNSEKVTFSVNIPGNITNISIPPTNVTNDTTPPGSVSGLYVLDATNRSIIWQWNNPGDNDFAGTIIYLNGNNIANLTSGTNQYIASGLSANTTYTIMIFTKDNSGNVNTTGASSTIRTLANPTGNNNNQNNNNNGGSSSSSSGGSSGNYYYTPFSTNYDSGSNGIMNYTADNSDRIVLESTSKKSTVSSGFSWMLWITFGIVIVFIVMLLVLVFRR